MKKLFVFCYFIISCWSFKYGSHFFTIDQDIWDIWMENLNIIILECMKEHIIKITVQIIIILIVTIMEKTEDVAIQVLDGINI